MGRRIEGEVSTLLLLRHAKSDWGGDAPDHDRPLAKRGIRAARAIAAHMREHGIAPDLVLCSSARRTVQTLDLVAPALAPGARRLVEHDLYLAGAEELLQRIATAPERATSLLVIGHNPGMHDLAVLLAGGPAGNVARLQEGFPTAALAVLDTRDTPWRSLTRGAAELVDLVLPRGLA
jgi:phosphohistidine phosphatase